MVSVREIRRIIGTHTARGIKEDAVVELQSRSERLVAFLVKLSSEEATRRGNESTRISREDIMLAWTRIMDEVE